MRSIGGSLEMVPTVIVCTAVLPEAILPVNFVPVTLMPAAGREHRIKKTINPMVRRDRACVLDPGFISGQLHIIIPHAYIP
jgi:hypothetical protein